MTGFETLLLLSVSANSIVVVSFEAGEIHFLAEDVRISREIAIQDTMADVRENTGQFQLETHPHIQSIALLSLYLHYTDNHYGLQWWIIRNSSG